MSRRLTGGDVKVISLYVVATTVLGLAAGFLFRYGFPAGGLMLAIAAAIVAFMTGVEVAVRQEDR